MIHTNTTKISSHGFNLRSIDVNKMFASENCFEYSKDVERAIISLLSNFYDVILYSLSEGYNPKFDAIINLCGSIQKIELKCAGAIQTKNGKKLTIEHAYYNGKPSGLSVTEASCYIVCSVEYNKGHLVGKIRLYPVSILKSLLSRAEHYNEIIGYKPNDYGPGARVFEVNPYDEKAIHVWLGNFKINPDQTWDLTTLTKVNKYALRKINNIQKQGLL